VTGYADLIRRLWFVPLLFLPRRAARSVIEADVRRWCSMPGVSVDATHANPLLALLAAYPEFRSLYYHRLRRSGDPSARLLAIVAAALYPGQHALFLACDDIGPGLFLQHGFATIVIARHVGTDCWINQQVTIGYRKDGETHGPWIGDGVRVGAGAKVLGEIVIGDGATIGANAVVLHDVPAGHTAVGVPAKLIPPRP
jgi:serine O-acetyltransferase